MSHKHRVTSLLDYIFSIMNSNYKIHNNNICIDVLIFRSNIDDAVANASTILWISSAEWPIACEKQFSHKYSCGICSSSEVCDCKEVCILV